MPQIVIIATIINPIIFILFIFSGNIPYSQVLCDGKGVDQVNFTAVYSH
jgi:hypothetical protein